MKLTKAYITYIRSSYALNLDSKLEKYLLAQSNKEPFPNEWTEQDLYEQIRKLCINYKVNAIE